MDDIKEASITLGLAYDSIRPRPGLTTNEAEQRAAVYGIGLCSSGNRDYAEFQGALRTYADEANAADAADISPFVKEGPFTGPVTKRDAVWENEPAADDNISIPIFAIELKATTITGETAAHQLAYDLSTAQLQRLAIGLPDAEIFGCTVLQGDVRIRSMRWSYKANSLHAI
ncbi:hypothetical protein FA95DRAFT_1604972 [Auriscalpium vulgare]|uniref:Uncharacterized protein n=1 Tax=Auriscalpium vulgare TaxID=40419 RepID=A0ACB8RWT4_9AGAM|nr:hypothetical protein FA95DRAFT_1604972 [Auriscalpium vulgare]